VGTLSRADASPFERLGVVGLGLIGGSVALAAKRRLPSIVVTVCDPAPTSVEAVTQGLASAIVDAPADLTDCDLIVIATPVQTVPGIIQALSEAGVRGLVTDVGSTKRTVMAAAGASRLVFVGGHPMVDTSSPGSPGSPGASGLAGARADLFDDRPWLLVSGLPERPQGPTVADGRAGPADGISPAVLEALLATFVVGLGARLEWTDAVTHDKVMAHVSHTPQLVSTALTSASPSDAWLGILETNADFIADALETITQKLPTSAEALTSTPLVRDVLARARALKRQGFEQGAPRKTDA
jgi:prephenate dehydrogenase